ncbi:unnamed protein product [Adineta ricciae]|uniref:Uncharacterized protein n=1 Tax=Adineta ricciae TaxID=249248 RepID=A0A813SWC0_ADIRI|nr:unnamed protein product [Adineta ricciae]
MIARGSLCYHWSMIISDANRYGVFRFESLSYLIIRARDRLNNFDVIRHVNNSKRSVIHHDKKDEASLRWYKDCFHKAFSVLHGLSRDDSPSALLEKSLKQSHLNKRISKNIVNDLQKKTKPTRVRRILASSMTPPPKDEKDQNQRCVRVLKSVDFDQQPNDN